MSFLIVQMSLILTCLCFSGRLWHFQANPKETSCSFALSESTPFICVPVLSFLFLTWEERWATTFNTGPTQRWENLPELWTVYWLDYSGLTTLSERSTRKIPTSKKAPHSQHKKTTTEIVNLLNYFYIRITPGLTCHKLHKFLTL